MTTKLQPQTSLERNVARWANAQAANYDGGLQAVFNDLFYGGCAYGMVGHLIYYKDTLAFYRTHRAAIETLLKDMMSDMGAKSPPTCLATSGTTTIHSVVTRKTATCLHGSALKKPPAFLPTAQELTASLPALYALHSLEGITDATSATRRPTNERT